jgi:hypothetical protein
MMNNDEIVNEYEERMGETISVDFGEFGFIHPSYITERVMKGRAEDWNKEAQDKAVCLWQLAVCMPDLTGRVLTDIIEGKRKVWIDDDRFLVIDSIEESDKVAEFFAAIETAESDDDE